MRHTDSSGNETNPPNGERLDAEATVYIVDDDEAVRESVVALVETIGLKAKSFASAQAFLDSYDCMQSGCLVTDVRMLQMSGIELQDELLARELLVPVILLTAHADVRLVVEAMHKGAVTVLDKPCRAEELWDAIDLALRIDAKQGVKWRERRLIRERVRALTPEERQIIGLIASGTPNKVIATALDMSPRTIDAHRRNLLDKMNVESVVDLIRALVEAKIERS